MCYDQIGRRFSSFILTRRWFRPKAHIVLTVRAYFYELISMDRRESSLFPPISKLVRDPRSRQNSLLVTILLGHYLTLVFGSSFILLDRMSGKILKVLSNIFLAWYMTSVA